MGEMEVSLNLSSPISFLWERYKFIPVPVDENKVFHKTLARKIYGVEGWKKLYEFPPEKIEEKLEEFEKLDNVAMVIPEGYVVLDLDDPAWVTYLRLHGVETFTTKTRRGYHFYFRGEWKKKKSILHTKEGESKGIDVKVGGKGYVVVKSPHHTAIRQTEISEMPDEVKKRLEFLVKYEKEIERLASVWFEGDRHNQTLSLAARLKKKGWTREEAEMLVSAICIVADDKEIDDRIRAVKDTYEREKISEEHASESFLELLDELFPLSRKKEEEGKLEVELIDDDEVERLHKRRIYPIGIIEDEKGERAYIVAFRYARLKKNGSETIRKIPVVVFEDGGRIPGLLDEIKMHGYEWGTEISELSPYVWDGILVDAEPLEIYNEVKQIVMKYVDFSDEKYYDLVSLWIIGTYFHRLFAAYPYLWIHGIKGSGKTTLGDVIRVLSFNSIKVTNTSLSATFRAVESTSGTFILDEGERINRDEELRLLFNAGYKRGEGAIRVDETRKKGAKKFVVRRFDVYSPKVIISIDQIHHVTAHRSIRIIMMRTIREDIASREVIDDPAVWREIRRKLHTLYLRKWRDIKQIYDQLDTFEGLASALCGGDFRMKECSSDRNEEVQIGSNMYCNRVCKIIDSFTTDSRAYELFRPLLALAIFFEREGVSIFPVFVDLVLKVLDDRKMETRTESSEIYLIETLNDLLNERGDGWYSLSEITSHTRNYAETDGDFYLSKTITSRWVSKVLKRYDFSKKRMARGTQVLITKEKLEDLMKRLGIEDLKERNEEKENVRHDIELSL